MRFIRNGKTFSTNVHTLGELRDACRMIHDECELKEATRVSFEVSAEGRGTLATVYPISRGELFFRVEHGEGAFILQTNSRPTPDEVRERFGIKKGEWLSVTEVIPTFADFASQHAARRESLGQNTTPQRYVVRER